LTAPASKTAASSVAAIASKAASVMEMRIMYARQAARHVDVAVGSAHFQAGWRIHKNSSQECCDCGAPGGASAAPTLKAEGLGNLAKVADSHFLARRARTMAARTARRPVDGIPTRAELIQRTAAATARPACRSWSRDSAGQLIWRTLWSHTWLDTFFS
jgi:hypothetical protein